MSRSISLVAAMLMLACVPAVASIDPAGVANLPVMSSKSCSGAFRYAARVGNDDIMMLSIAQLSASVHRMTRARVAGRAVNFERTSWNTLTAMCGAR